MLTKDILLILYGYGLLNAIGSLRLGYRKIAGAHVFLAFICLGLLLADILA